jgi:hypothetical protein
VKGGVSGTAEQGTVSGRKVPAPEKAFDATVTGYTKQESPDTAKKRRMPFFCRKVLQALCFYQRKCKSRNLYANKPSPVCTGLGLFAL